MMILGCPKELGCAQMLISDNPFYDVTKQRYIQLSEIVLDAFLDSSISVNILWLSLQRWW